MDGLEYHAETVAKDLLDRIEMIRSGKVQVWTLSWHDLLEEKAPPFLNPLHGMQCRVLIGNYQKFSTSRLFFFGSNFKALRESGSFQSHQVLEGNMDLSSTRCSSRKHSWHRPTHRRPPRASDLSEEGRHSVRS